MSFNFEKSKPVLFAGGLPEDIKTGLIQSEAIYSGAQMPGAASGGGGEPPVPTYTFTINPTPADAVVTINGQNVNSITAKENTAIDWSVEADGYEAQSGNLILTEDTTLDVILLAEGWHQTAELNAEIKGVSSGSNGDLEAAKAAIWEHGYNNFAGNVPSDYINWTGTKSLRFYVILPRKTFVKSFWICAYNQYSINTVSYKSWSETDNEDTTSDNREYFLKISASDEFKSSATVNAEVKRLDVYINMSGTGKFNLYGFRVET